MRLDKFLKVSRLIKRRTVAKEFAESQKITVNGRVAKPSSEVKTSDLLVIQMGGRKLTVEILEIKENAKTSEALNLYRIVSEEPPPS
jgi:ribosomal 50S subunit-recycling heat shock protein